MKNLNLLPAILIGGPPRSGKSVLAYSLSQALRKRNIAHYLLRAAPDGEGDWAQEMDWERVRAIRFKGQWDEHWVRVVCRDIAARPLPLLVDVGGCPTEEQLVIFDQCTAAIVIAPNDDDAQWWRMLVTRRGLTLVADLRSMLDGEDVFLPSAHGELRGVICGLQRGRQASGVVFEALVEHVARLFDLPQEELARRQLAAAPREAHVVRFDLLARDPDLAKDQRFVEERLDAILARVPEGEPIAAYGRMPVWLVTALGARRDLRWQFDSRLGWVRTPRFAVAAPGEVLPEVQAGLRFALVRESPQRVQLHVSRVAYYLDYAEMEGVRVPYMPSEARVYVNGPSTPAGGLPLWVFAALGRAYRYCAEVRALQAHAQMD